MRGQSQRHTGVKIKNYILICIHSLLPRTKNDDGYEDSDNDIMAKKKKGARRMSISDFEAGTMDD